MGKNKFINSGLVKIDFAYKNHIIFETKKSAGMYVPFPTLHPKPRKSHRAGFTTSTATAAQRRHGTVDDGDDVRDLSLKQRRWKRLGDQRFTA